LRRRQGNDFRRYLSWVQLKVLVDRRESNEQRGNFDEGKRKMKIEPKTQKVNHLREAKMVHQGEVVAKGMEDFAKRVERHPVLKARMMRILDVVENASGDVRRAADAERRAIDELRMMGQEVLQGWGQGLAEQEARNWETGGSVIRQAKKNFTGTARSVK
jgi:hypothetical protein